MNYLLFDQLGSSNVTVSSWAGAPGSIPPRLVYIVLGMIVGEGHQFNAEKTTKPGAASSKARDWVSLSPSLDRFDLSWLLETSLVVDGIRTYSCGDHWSDADKERTTPDNHDWRVSFTLPAGQMAQEVRIRRDQSGHGPRPLGGVHGLLPSVSQMTGYSYSILGWVNWEIPAEVASIWSVPMDKPKPANKQIEDLAFKDFAAYPIWGFADDDGDEVMPVDYPGYLKAPDGGEGWFVACEFALRDGSRLPGVIYVRTTDRSIYMLVFSRPDGEFFHFPVNSRMEGRVTPEQLAAQLHKSVEDLFPITYTTPFVFKDGQKLFGQYDFPARHK